MVVFCDPPVAAKGVMGSWNDRLVALVERPGEWARLDGDFSRHTAGQLRRKGGKLRIPAGRWRFVSRSVPDVPKGRVAIWARYEGA